MTIISTPETAWRELQSKHRALLTPFGPVSLLLMVSTLAFASSVSDMAGPGQTEMFPQLAVPALFGLPYSVAVQSEFNEIAPPPDPATLLGFADPFLSSTPPVNPESAPMSEQAHDMTAFIGVILLAEGLILYLRSPTFHDWLEQFLFDAFSPLKYD